MSRVRRVPSDLERRLRTFWKCIWSLECVLSALGRVYLLRIPLLTAIGIVGFCYFAFFTGVHHLLGNAFYLDSPFDMFFVSTSAFLAAWVVVTTWRLVRLYGPERFLDASSSRTSSNIGSMGLASYALLFMVVALPPIGGAIYKSAELSLRWELFWIFAAFLMSLIVRAVVIGVQLLFTRPDVVRDSSDPGRFRPALVWPFGPVLDRSLSLKAFPSLAGWITSLIRKLLKPHGGRGYVEHDEEGRVVSIQPGHVMAFTLLVLTLIAYLLIGWADFRRLKNGEPPLVPTVSHVIILAILLCWLLSSFAFFLDRYRIPVLVPVLLWLGLTAALPWSDYFYPVKERGQTTQSAPSEGATEVEPPADDSIIVVAANGGGIQAAAWAARVLTGLEQECRKTPSCGERFGKSIRLISAVSGSSVGTMYFVNEYEEGRLPPDDELDEIVGRAQRSSLDEIAWGLLYPDLLRTIIPVPIPWDRGRALEEAWLRSDASWARSEGIREGLSAWRQDARAGYRPAVIFNTTVAETGERLPLATTELPAGSAGRIKHDQLFNNTEGELDIAVVTATRLSASFPYVSPAARADIEGQAAHIVDGGYYDNYGISSLVEWLDAQLESEDNTIERVLILEIRGARSRIGPPDNEGCSETRPGGRDRRSNRGWFFQAFAPASTVFNVRTAGQRTHNEAELCLLIDKWKERREKADEVEITRAVFEFDSADTPTSWHLTGKDKSSIQENWEAEIVKEHNKRYGWERVRDFLTTAAASERGTPPNNSVS
jgi:hypothetical protein